MRKTNYEAKLPDASELMLNSGVQIPKVDPQLNSASTELGASASGVSAGSSTMVMDSYASTRGYVRVRMFVVTLILTILLGIMSGVLGFLLLLGPGYTYSYETGLIGGADVVLDGTIDLQTMNEIAEREKNKNDPFSVTYVVTPNPWFLTGTSAGTLALENPPESMYDMILSIYLENGLHVYTSPKLKPIQYMTSAKLNKDLDAGSYKAQGFLSFYDCNTGDYVGRQGINMTITIES